MAFTSKGHFIDMASMASANAHMRAVGNAQMNARGDKINHRGEVIKTREQIDRETAAYNRENPNSVRTAISALEADTFMTPADVYKKEPRKMTVEATPVDAVEKVQAPTKTKRVISDD